MGCSHPIISIFGGWCQCCKTQPYRIPVKAAKRRKRIRPEPPPESGIILAYVDEDPESAVELIDHSEIDDDDD